MTPTLDDLLNDGRLARLFSKNDLPCALQLWILQVKSERSIESRVIYGRLLPYSYSSNRWSASDDDNFHNFGQTLAQIIRLNLYIKSVQCVELLRQLSAGRTVSEISEQLQLDLSEQFEARFGATALISDQLVFRPVAYLLNRDAQNLQSTSSPHGGAGAFSASITRTDKAALFRLDQRYDVAFTESVIKHLDADTGLNFGGADTARFGDLELMVFPALDDFERSLLNISWIDTPLTLVAQFNCMQLPHFSGFQFRLNIENDDNLVYSCVATAEHTGGYEFECKFELNDQLHAMTDSTELEIFGFNDDHPGKGMLCCRWRIGYIREFHVNSHVVGHRASPVTFDWLEKATRPSASERVKTALTINRHKLEFENHIGGRGPDPWVPANRDLTSLFTRLHPPKSEGRFFQRWGQGDGEGRLQFVEWFKKLLAKYQEHQIVIFDPYFETAGLGLMLLCAAPKANYVVFTSLSKPSKTGNASQGEFDKPISDRVSNLVASCNNNRQLLISIKFRIYGLKPGRLHDRYILIMAPDGLPVAGFNLSNSFQSAAENYPLLVTPIPADTLLEIEQYKSGLVREAEAGRSESDTENPQMRLLFDSTVLPTPQRRYEPLRFLEKAQAGDVLFLWTGQPSLKGLSGDPLKNRMAVLDMLNDDSLSLPEEGLRRCLDHQAGDFSNFTPIWEMLGELLAHSFTEDHARFRELESERGFLEFLAWFLETSFNRANDEEHRELAVIDAQFFLKSVETLLHSSYRSEQLAHPVKYTAVTWSEYFTIKFLWWYASNTLLAITEAQIGSLTGEPEGIEAVRLSLLSQIVSEISLATQFGISEVQRDRLVCSNNGLLQWMGLNAIERKLEKPGGLAAVLPLVTAFPHSDRVRALGWMVHRAARNPEATDNYNGLTAALHAALPPTISADELRYLIDSMRGHMHRLGWAEPWLFQDVIFPLLQSDRASTDDACEIWIQELGAMLEPELGHRLFDRAREGQTTNITAFLFAYSGPERQLASLKSIKAILKRQQPILQQLLASTSDWSRWDDALLVSMWILTFARWGEYYLRKRDSRNLEIEELSWSAHDFAMRRPMNEWRLSGGSRCSELAAFLDQVDELLASTKRPGS